VKTLRRMIGTILCLMGSLLVLFEIGMAKSEPHTVRGSGLLVLLLFVTAGATIFVGGTLLLVGSCRAKPAKETRTPKRVVGTILGAMGVACVALISAQAISERHSFLRDGWIPFVVFVVFGVIIFAGGLLLWKD
jgi:hypothetical protein